MRTALLLVTAAVVVAIYLLRPPPRRVVVPSTLLFERLLEERSPLRERLRWLLSLLLALALALSFAAALGLAPWLARAGPAEAVLVIDNHPGMQTLRSDGSTRLQAAVAAARQRILEASASGRFLIGDTAGTLVPLAMVSRHEALRLLDTLDAPLGRPLRFPPVGAASAEAASTEIVPTVLTVFTDGAGPVLPPPGAEVVSVYEPARNVGITAFEVARVNGGGPVEAYLEMLHRAPEAGRVRLELRDGAGLRLERELELSAGELWSGVLDVSRWRPGSLEARVSLMDARGQGAGDLAPDLARGDLAGDDFPLDDRAWAILPDSSPLAVLLVTARSGELARLLRDDPGVALDVLAPSDVPQDERELERWDLLVGEGWAPEVEPDRPLLLVAPPARPWLSLAPGTGAPPDRGAPSGDHPVLESVALGRLEVEVSPPLLLVRDRAPRRVVLAFELPDTSLPSQSAFPILIGNALGWLMGDQPTAQRPGLVPLQAPALGAERVDAQAGGEVSDVGNVAEVAEVAESGQSADVIPTLAIAGRRFARLEQPGLYRPLGAKTPVVVNLASREESDVNTTRTTASPKASTDVTSDHGPARALSPRRWGWRPFVALGLVLAVLEAVTFRRRLTL